MVRKIGLPSTGGVSEETLRRWRREERARRDRAMVKNCQGVKRALRAAGIRAKVSPSPVYGLRHREVIVTMLEE